MMQIQTDLLGYPVEVVSNSEATAGGVCCLAARASGLWPTDELILQQAQVMQTYEPAISEDQRQAHLDKFKKAIQHLKAWHNHD
jgi:glycerol kinase